MTLLARAVPLMHRQPRFAGTWLATAVAVTSGPIEVAIAASDSSDDANLPALVRAAWQGAAPGRVVAHREPVAGPAAAYICRGFVCEAPTTDPAQVAEALNRR